MAKSNASTIALDSPVPVAAVANVPVVDALPSSPNDGDICFFQTSAMASNNVMWQLRYRNSGSYKWEFVGGPPVGMAWAGNSAASALADQTFTCPLRGLYKVEAGFIAQGANTDGACYLYVNRPAAQGGECFSGSRPWVDVRSGTYWRHTGYAVEYRIEVYNGTITLDMTNGRNDPSIFQMWCQMTPLALYTG